MKYIINIQAKTEYNNSDIFCERTQIRKYEEVLTHIINIKRIIGNVKSKFKVYDRYISKNNIIILVEVPDDEKAIKMFISKIDSMSNTTCEERRKPTIKCNIK